MGGFTAKIQTTNGLTHKPNKNMQGGPTQIKSCWWWIKLSSEHKFKACWYGVAGTTWIWYGVAMLLSWCGVDVAIWFRSLDGSTDVLEWYRNCSVSSYLPCLGYELQYGSNAKGICMPTISHSQPRLRMQVQALSNILQSFRSQQAHKYRPSKTEICPKSCLSPIDAHWQKYRSPHGLPRATGRALLPNMR